MSECEISKISRKKRVAFLDYFDFLAWFKCSESESLMLLRNFWALTFSSQFEFSFHMLFFLYKPPSGSCRVKFSRLENNWIKFTPGVEEDLKSFLLCFVFLLEILGVGFDTIRSSPSLDHPRFQSIDVVESSRVLYFSPTKKSAASIFHLSLSPSSLTDCCYRLQLETTSLPEEGEGEGCFFFVPGRFGFKVSSDYFGKELGKRKEGRLIHHQLF